MPVSIASKSRRQSWGVSGEKSHVVKELEHESKVFNFEQNVNSLGHSLKRGYR